VKWFKHNSTANMDAKLQEVLLDYGLEGYGLYWYCLELVAGNVEPENLTFELEHDCRIIARNTGSSEQRIQEMMTRFTDLGLFENIEGRITCLKLAKMSDDYTSKLVRKKPLQAPNSKGDRQTPTNSEKDPLDKKRLEENKLDKNKIDKDTNGKKTTLPSVPKKSKDTFDLPNFISTDQWAEIQKIKKSACKQAMTDRAGIQLINNLTQIHGAGYNMEQVLNLWSEYPHWKTMTLEYMNSKLANVQHTQQSAKTSQRDHAANTTIQERVEDLGWADGL